MSRLSGSITNPNDRIYRIRFKSAFPRKSRMAKALLNLSKIDFFL